MKAEGRVGERDGVSPGYVLGRVGCGGGLKFDPFVVVDNAVASGGVPVPEWPPSTVVLREGAISGRGGEEVAVVDTRV